MNTNASKHLYEALLVGATVAIRLVAVLMARAAQLDDGTWLSVLAPFGLVAGRPLGRPALATHRPDIKEPLQAPSSPAQDHRAHPPSGS